MCPLVTSTSVSESLFSPYCINIIYSPPFGYYLKVTLEQLLLLLTL